VLWFIASSSVLHIMVNYIFLQTICVGVIVMWWLSSCVEYRRSKAAERVNWVSTIKRHFHV